MYVCECVHCPCVCFTCVSMRARERACFFVFLCVCVHHYYSSHMTKEDPLLPITRAISANQSVTKIILRPKPGRVADMFALQAKERKTGVLQTKPTK